MYNIIFVEKGEGFEASFADSCDLRLREDSLCDHIGQGTPIQVLHHYPQLLAYQITLYIVHYVLLLSGFHHLLCEIAFGVDNKFRSNYVGNIKISLY